MNSVLHGIFSLRCTIPIAFTLSIAPPYFCFWAFIRAISTLIPTRNVGLYRKVDDFLYDTYQSTVVFFLETYTGTELVFYGDEIPWDKKENVLYLCNHQSTVDWAVVDMIAIRQNCLGYIRYILKDSLRFLPFYGFYFPQHGCIYVKRSAASDIEKIQRKLKSFKTNGTPLWLVIFPEGTRLQLNNNTKLKQSEEFAKSRGLPVLKHLLTPRTKATEVALEQLGDHLDIIYDLTIAYKDKYGPCYPRQPARTLVEFLKHQDQEIHIHVRRVTPDQIPQDSEGRKQWIFDAFAKKDSLLSEFYSEDILTQGRFPGNGRRRDLPITRTLPWVVFWAGVISPFLATKYGRDVYWRSWLAGSIGTVLYMTILYDKLQG